MNDLVESICAFLGTVVANYSLETNQKATKSPQVVAGWLPPKRSSDIPDFPYVIVRASDGKDTEEIATVTVKILVGTYAEDPNGFRDVLNIMERIRIAFGEQRVLEKKYRMEYPFSWRLFDDQPYPEWAGEITTTWVVPLPQEILSTEEEARIYGQGY